MILKIFRSDNLHVSRIFEVSAPVNCACLHPNQAELFVGDQSGVIHIWDIRTEHNEQLVSFQVCEVIFALTNTIFEILMAFHILLW